MNIPVVSRAAVLAGLFNDASTSIGVAGTSGKTTTTGMIGWILYKAGLNPMIMNGAVMKNFVAPDFPFASAVIGDPNLFVSEVDESDGSIALFTPDIAVVNNVALDHKPVDELRVLFQAFTRKASRVILNLDNVETAALASGVSRDGVMTYSLRDPSATFFASEIRGQGDAMVFSVKCQDAELPVCVSLKMRGRHNVANALAAMAAAKALGVDARKAAESLSEFAGIGRRLDVVGNSKGRITVIDDFAHNPDKIAASLGALRETSGRLLVLFQPHGYGPLRLMRTEMAHSFAENLADGDMLFVCDPLYLGGSTERPVSSDDLVKDIVSFGKKATYLPEREECAQRLVEEASADDKIIVMGARDDTLTALAHTILFRLDEPKG